MRKYLKVAALTMACVMVLTGCGSRTQEAMETVTQTTETETVVETAPETETETESVEEETLSVIGEREVVDGQMQSYLTGEWKDEEVVTRRPIAVMIPNNA